MTNACVWEKLRAFGMEIGIDKLDLLVITNLPIRLYHIDNRVLSNSGDLVHSGFTWADSSEGSNFWRDIFLKLENMENIYASQTE